MVHKDESIEHLQSVGKIIGRIDGITLTGGEPTFHEQFAEIAVGMKTWFDFGHMVIETNGYGLRKYADLLASEFAMIAASGYDGSFGGPSNQDDINWFRHFLASKGMENKLQTRVVGHFPRNTIGSSMCWRGESGTVILHQGKLYGCCAASGQQQKVGCDVTPTWKEDVLRLPLPCEGCVFAV